MYLWNGLNVARKWPRHVQLAFNTIQNYNFITALCSIFFWSSSLVCRTATMRLRFSLLLVLIFMCLWSWITYLKLTIPIALCVNRSPGGAATATATERERETHKRAERSSSRVSFGWNSKILMTAKCRNKNHHQHPTRNTRRNEFCEEWNG